MSRTTIPIADTLVAAILEQVAHYPAETACFDAIDHPSDLPV
jgi:hypothetical protein